MSGRKRPIPDLDKFKFNDRFDNGIRVLVTHYIWLICFVIVFPVCAYIAARHRGIDHKSLLPVLPLLLAIPLLLISVALLANIFDLGLDSQAIHESHDSPREFFTALEQAQRPYEYTVFAIVLVQLPLLCFAVLLMRNRRMFTFISGICGFHLSIFAGILLLNVLLGEWPGS